MARKHNTDRIGSAWSEATKLAVWKTADTVPGEDSNKIRKDACGAFISYVMHGDTTINGMGWEIDHIVPVAKGGSDRIENLQPLQWQNNRAKGDDYPAHNYCVVVAK